MLLVVLTCVVAEWLVFGRPCTSFEVRFAGWGNWHLGEKPLVIKTRASYSEAGIEWYSRTDYLIKGYSVEVGPIRIYKTYRNWIDLGR
jgi:hypothetical protein